MTYRFGPFELDPAAGELRRDGRAVAIQPTPLALLTLLIEERHRIVPTAELLDRLWPGETVTPSSLTRAVSVARTALDDRGRNGRIRSYTRRGYRFHGDVVELDGARSAAAPDAEPDACALAEGGLPFVGRADALAQLEAAWERAARGRGSNAVVRGAAGVGKTRLSERFVSRVAARGGLALRGRSLEDEGEPAFWVWAQVLRGLAREDPDALREPGLADSGELAVLMPELGAPGAGAAARLPAEQRQFVFFDAVARALAGAARRRPLLVTFEDLHWADPASLRLLEHLAFELAREPGLLVATLRDGPERLGEPERRALAALRRQERSVAVALSGFARDEVAQLVERLAGRPLPALAERLFARTDGLPLFVGEACRRLAERGAFAARDAAEGDLAIGAGDWVADALGRLSEPCVEIVRAASVVGRAFALPLVADAARVPREAALDRLDEAVRAGVVAPDADAPARYRFVHDLFREAAYAALAPAARVRLHRRVAEELERRHAGDPDGAIAELAHHHHRALAVGDPERAFACARRAAERAFDVCAYEQAARHGRQALDALDQVPDADPGWRLETLLDLGEASRLADDRDARRRHFGEAMALARKLGRPEAAGAAAIGMCDIGEWGVRDEPARAALEDALAGLERPPAGLEAQILTRLGYLDSMFDPARAEALLRRAVKLARGIGASDLLEEALYALHFHLGGPDGLAERAEILEELRGAASAARDPVASVIALLDVACDRLELGDAAGAAQLRREADRRVGRPPHPRTIWHRLVYDTGLALLEGRLGEVEGRADEAGAIGARVQHPYADACRVAHQAWLHVARGEPGEALQRLEPTLGARQGPGTWVRALVARCRHALGDAAGAREAWASALEPGLDAIPRNLRWIATLVELAHACADVASEADADALIARLAPFESHHAVMPMVICYGGPASWALARLHELRGRGDAALELYASARAAAGELGALPTCARIRLDAGRLLRRRGRRSDARAELAAAAALAADLGLPALERAACAELGARGA